MSTLQTHHSVANVPRLASDERVAKVAANIRLRRPFLAQSTVLRAAEGLAAAQTEAAGMSYLLRGDRCQRDFNRSLDGSMSLPFDAVADLPEHGSRGARVFLALVTPCLAAISHRPVAEMAEDHGIDAAHAGFIRAAGDLAAAYVMAKADGHISAEERRELDAQIARAESWLASARAAVRRS
jgi:hypothetical protein